MTKHLTHIIITGIVVAVVGAPVAAIAAGTKQNTHRPSGHSAAALTPRCSSSHVSVSVVGEQGALGTTYWDLALRNVGRATCHTRGYPGVGLVDRSSRLISVPVQRVPGTPEPTVTLRPGQSAYFTFGYAGEVGACSRHFSAYGVQIIPPNETQRLVLRTRRFDVCTPSRSVGNPSVYPLRTGLRLNG